MQTYTCAECGKTHTTKDGHKGLKYCSIKCAKISQNKVAEQKFIARFNFLFSERFLYVSGYSGSESRFYCKCLICGELKQVIAGCIRQGHSKPECKFCASKKAKEQNNIKLSLAAADKQRRLANKLKLEEEKYTSICNECGLVFKGERRGAKYCSDVCRKKHNNRYHEVNRRNKIRENGRIDWSISLSKLVRKDKDVCHICGEKVDMSIDTNSGRYGSIDHVIPISKGGTHTWDNVKLAHRECNSLKRDRVSYSIENGQIPLLL